MKLLNRINNVLLQMTYSLLVKSQKAASQIVTIGCVLFLIGCDNDNSNNGVAPERARLIKITPRSQRNRAIYAGNGNSFSINRWHRSKSMVLMPPPTQQCRWVLGSQQLFGYWI